MEKFHPIGRSFIVTFDDGVKVRLVACESETFHDNQFNEDFRKTCIECYFCTLKRGYCSGHPYWDEVCTLGGCKIAKCSPEFRTDGKFIHYKKIHN